MKKLKKENQQLQKLLGEKMLQIELLQEAVALAREKKLISAQPFPWEADIAGD
jgi:transposase